MIDFRVDTRATDELQHQERYKNINPIVIDSNEYQKVRNNLNSLRTVCTVVYRK